MLALLGKGSCGSLKSSASVCISEPWELITTSAGRLVEVENDLVPVDEDFVASSCMILGALSWPSLSRFRICVQSVSELISDLVCSTYLLYGRALVYLRPTFACNLPSGCCLFADMWQLFLIWPWPMLLFGFGEGFFIGSN